MAYLSEFVGSLVFLLMGYAYMCNISLKKTLVGTLNYIELVLAWSLAVAFGLGIAVTMGGMAFLNPCVVIGSLFLGSITFNEALMYLLMEFLASGVAIAICRIFFHDSFKATEGGQFRGIFSAYPVEKNIPLNFIQEAIATFSFLFLVLLGITYSGGNPIKIGIVGFGAVAVIALTLNSTGFSMNPMRSVFSAIWYTIIPIPNKSDTTDWKYQVIVNVCGSMLGGVLAVIAVSFIQAAL